MKNHTLIIVKIFAAISVVLIHTSSFIYHQNIANLYNYFWYRPIFNFAVPFFFSASGYILSLKEVSYFKVYMKKIAFLYIMYSILYFLFTLFLRLGNDILQGDTFSNSFVNFIKERSFIEIINGTIGFYPLWYLWALLVGTYILYVLLKYFVSLKKILYCSTVFFILSILLRYFPFIDNVLYEGGFIKALLFLIIGYYVGRDTIIIDYPLCKTLFTLIVYVILFQFFKFNLILDLLLIPLIYYLMHYIVRNPGKENLLSTFGKYSTQVYLHHMFFVLGYTVLITIFPQLLITNIFLRILVVTLSAVILSIILKIPIEKFYLNPFSEFFY